jgi:hypothetical protein
METKEVMDLKDVSRILMSAKMGSFHLLHAKFASKHMTSWPTIFE